VPPRYVKDPRLPPEDLHQDRQCIEVGALLQSLHGKIHVDVAGQVSRGEGAEQQYPVHLVGLAKQLHCRGKPCPQPMAEWPAGSFTLSYRSQLLG
jgi:hypothetical protein